MRDEPAKSEQMIREQSIETQRFERSLLFDLYSDHWELEPVSPKNQSWVTESVSDRVFEQWFAFHFNSLEVDRLDTKLAFPT